MEQSLVPVRVISQSGRTPEDIRELLSAEFKIRSDSFQNLKHTTNFENDVVIFDMINCSEPDIEAVRLWRTGFASLSNITVFITTDEGRRILLQKGMLSGSNCVRRPLTEENLPDFVLSLYSARAAEIQRNAAEFQHRLQILFPDQAAAVMVGENILEEIMTPFNKGQMVNIQLISEKTSILIDTLNDTGIDRWVASVRMHHNPTYQHSLLVTGTIVAFGKLLGMNGNDMKRLAIGGLMHDLGKSDIPISILDKESKLSPAEMDIMRLHPAAGVQRASKIKGMSQDLLQLIGDHHEYLDGTGYPHGLSSNEISDPVRLLTIADIFAALVERRPYKQPMDATKALDMMHSMDTKLDMAFLKATEPVMLQVSP
jgi:HD-GYP domain-containing protein (c-di-GMP phosphodiesterase class II)